MEVVTMSTTTEEEFPDQLKLDPVKPLSLVYFDNRNARARLLLRTPRSESPRLVPPGSVSAAQVAPKASREGVGSEHCTYCANSNSNSNTPWPRGPANYN